MNYFSSSIGSNEHRLIYKGGPEQRQYRDVVEGTPDQQKMTEKLSGKLDAKALDTFKKQQIDRANKDAQKRQESYFKALQTAAQTEFAQAMATKDKPPEQALAEVQQDFASYGLRFDLVKTEDGILDLIISRQGETVETEVDTSLDIGNVDEQQQEAVQEALKDSPVELKNALSSVAREALRSQESMDAFVSFVEKFNKLPVPIKKEIVMKGKTLLDASEEDKKKQDSKLQEFLKGLTETEKETLGMIHTSFQAEVASSKEELGDMDPTEYEQVQGEISKALTGYKHDISTPEGEFAAQLMLARLQMKGADTSAGPEILENPDSIKPFTKGNKLERTLNRLFGGLAYMTAQINKVKKSIDRARGKKDTKEAKDVLDPRAVSNAKIKEFETFVEGYSNPKHIAEIRTSKTQIPEKDTHQLITVTIVPPATGFGDEAIRYLKDLKPDVEKKKTLPVEFLNAGERTLDQIKNQLNNMRTVTEVVTEDDSKKYTEYFDGVNSNILNDFATFTYAPDTKILSVEPKKDEFDEKTDAMLKDNNFVKEEEKTVLKDMTPQKFEALQTSINKRLEKAKEEGALAKEVLEAMDKPGQWIDGEKHDYIYSKKLDKIIRQAKNGRECSVYNPANQEWEVHAKNSGAIYSLKNESHYVFGSTEYYDAQDDEFKEIPRQQLTYDSEKRTWGGIDSETYKDMIKKRERQGVDLFNDNDDITPSGSAYYFDATGSTNYYFRFVGNKWKWAYAGGKEYHPTSKVPVDYGQGSDKIGPNQVGNPNMIFDLNDTGVEEVRKIILSLEDINSGTYTG